MSRFCVVLAGGLGSRIAAITGGLIPKILVPVNGIPFLSYKLLELKDLGFTDVLLLVGEKGDLVVEYLKANPTEGIRVKAWHDGPSLLGTAGAIKSIVAELPELFWVTYGDTLVRADLDLAEDIVSGDANSGLMTVLHNKNSLEPSNCSVSAGKVTRYSKVEKHSTFEWLDYGLLLLRKHHFVEIENGVATDLSFVIQSLVDKRALFSLEVSDRFWDIGTPEALKETERELRRRLQ